MKFISTAFKRIEITQRALGPQWSKLGMSNNENRKTPKHLKPEQHPSE